MTPKPTVFALALAICGAAPAAPQPGPRDDWWWMAAGIDENFIVLVYANRASIKPGTAPYKLADFMTYTERREVHGYPVKRETFEIDCAQGTLRRLANSEWRADLSASNPNLRDLPFVPRHRKPDYAPETTFLHFVCTKPVGERLGVVKDWRQEWVSRINAVAKEMKTN